MTEYETVRYEADTPVDRAVTVTIDRPAKRNAMNAQVRDDLYAATKRAAEDDDVRCIVMAGAGDAFSAGGDLESYLELDAVDLLDYNVFEGGGLYQWVARLPKPTIAAMDGYAFGGGAEIALAFDFRIASERTQMGFSEIKVGLFAVNSPHRLVHMCGITKAKELLLRGQTFTAEEGAEWGILTEVHPEGEAFEAAVAELAGELVERAPVAYRLGKKAIDRAILVDTGYEPMAYEKLAITTLFGTEDQKEGARAFLEDREPEFQGR